MRNDGTYLAQLLQEQQRPHPMHMRQQYHFMGGPGWINDPNGRSGTRTRITFSISITRLASPGASPAGVTR